MCEFHIHEQRRAKDTELGVYKASLAIKPWNLGIKSEPEQMLSALLVEDETKAKF